MRHARILVVDDEHLIRWSLEQNLKKQGHEVLIAADGIEALRLAIEEQPDIMLLDIQLPGMNGLDVLKEIKAQELDIMVVMITANTEIETAITAMKLGACDYLCKPFNMDELSIVIRKLLETSELKQEIVRLRLETKKDEQVKIVGESPQTKALMELLGRVAQSPTSTVLIQGESGTGKELVAKWLHQHSPRSNKSFIAINCAAMPATLLESELFGHEKGAFTDARVTKKGLFELADGGTVFLDEIGDMEIGMQAKLLRFLEERSFRRVGGSHQFMVDVQIISATNRHLYQAVEDKSFRNDLYYRLQVIPVNLAPLRERREDILPLANHYIELLSRRFNKNVVKISAMAERMLQEYSWPGNVRELRNVIERAIILGSDDTLLLEHLPLEMLASRRAESVPVTAPALPPEGVNLEDVERELIRQALESTNWNQSKAARKLNLGVDALRYRMKKYGYL